MGTRPKSSLAVPAAESGVNMGFVRSLALLSFAFIAGAFARPAQAQVWISYDQAVETMLLFVPECKVTKVEYATDPQTARTVVTVFGATNKLDIGYTLDIDAVTGVPNSIAAQPLLDFDRAILLPIMPRLQFCTMTYGQAAQTAATALSRPVNRVRLVMLGYANTLLTYTARFDDLVLVHCDAIAGVRLADGFEGEPVARATSTQLSSAISAAELALGPGWKFLRSKMVAQTPAVVCDIDMLEPVKNIVRRARVTLGAPNQVVLSAPFQARGTLAADADMRRNSAVRVPGTPQEAAARMHASATNIRFFDFRFSNLAGLPKWCGSVDSPQVHLSAEFTMILSANEPAATGFIWGRREFALAAGDFDRDARITAYELAEILNAWSAFYPPYDLNESGLIDAGDLAIILSAWR